MIGCVGSGLQVLSVFSKKKVPGCFLAGGDYWEHGGALIGVLRDKSAGCAGGVEERCLAIVGGFF